MTTLTRPLAGYILGLSISGGEDTEAYGFSNQEVNRTVLRFVAGLVGQGVGVSFGHDWRDDGIMESIHSYVERYQPVTPDQPRKPLLWNLIPWPSESQLPREQLRRLEGTLKVENVGLPPSLRQQSHRFSRKSDAYIRARALTHLRRKLTSISDARLCLGGRISGFQGRYPGVVEEAYFAIQSNRPIYISGVLGGASSRVIKAFIQANSPSDICPDTALSKSYEKPPLAERLNENQEDLTWSPNNVWKTFASCGIQGLSSANKLSPEENKRLFATQSIDEVIQLVLTGLGRVRRG